MANKLMWVAIVSLTLIATVALFQTEMSRERCKNLTIITKKGKLFPWLGIWNQHISTVTQDGEIKGQRVRKAEEFR